MIIYQRPNSSFVIHIDDDNNMCYSTITIYILYTHSINRWYIIIMCNKISFFCVSAVYSPCYLID